MNIKDMPHVTVEQVLALRKAAIELEQELATLKASLPKIKAEAVIVFCDWLLSEINWDVSHYGKKYANKLEAGELDDCECEELGSICDHCEDDV